MIPIVCLGSPPIMGASRGSKQFERNSAGQRRCSSIILKFLLLACFVGLGTFFLAEYPLERTDLVEVVLPEHAGGNWPRHAIISLEFVPKVSAAKIAALNETFLEFAAIDPSFEYFSERAKQILEERDVDFRNIEIKLRYQARLNRYVDLGGSRRPRGPRFEHWSVQIHSPKYRLSWPKFRLILHDWMRNKRHDPRVMGELMSSMKKPLDDYYRGSKFNQTAEEGKRYKTCAVVGNSGILVNRSFGPFIDSHDAVIRLNNAKVSGFEDSVGSKTTISFVNSNVYNACGRRLKCFCHPYGAVPIVLYICQAQHLMDIVYCEADRNAPVLVTDPRFDVLCSRLAKWYSVKHYVDSTGNSIESWNSHHNSKEFHYSSGFQAVMLALGICDQVDLLGFGKSPHAKHHYHTLQKTELDLHDYKAEYLFYDDLVFSKIDTIPFLGAAGIEIPPVQMYR